MTKNSFVVEVTFKGISKKKKNTITGSPDPLVNE